MNRTGRCVFLLLALLAGTASGQTLPSMPQELAHRRARELWMLKGRSAPRENTAALRQNALHQKLRLRALAAASSLSPSAGSGWVSLGPLPLPSDASGIGLQDYGWVSGRATAVAIDPNDPTGNTVFAGGAYGGVWKSNNAGPLSYNPNSVSWTPVTDAQATLAVGALAVQPQKSNPDPNKSIVLVGTGETNSSADSYYGLGILRSTDGGQSWTLISKDGTGTHSFAGLGFSRIVFSTADPNLVVAAASSASAGIITGLENPLAANRGLYYSCDAGATWYQATINDAGAAVSSAAATSVQFDAASGVFFAAIRFHGFYSSSDGRNWARLPVQPGTGLTPAVCPAQPAQTSCPIYRGEIAVVPNRAGSNSWGEMYVWYVDNSQADRGIWASRDGGASWIFIDDSAIANCGDPAGCGTAQGAYSLSLAALPNGNATDLYAGATNLYKCTITASSPACSGANGFLNLTHVYGCSDIGRVHPGQHAMDFLVANGTALLYFASGGGIYRALDGFTGLNAGTCGLSNQFDNLNATLGPMSQFVSLAQSATNIDLVFGGTQGNGAPATGSLQNGGPWMNTQAGDAGFTAINPGNESDWFVALPPDSASGVNVLRCPYGVNCHSQDFQNNQVVTSSTVGGDTGGFDLPFVLDPKNPGALLVGTCRMWRGSSSASAYSVLSPNFEIGGTATCSGSETNLIRSLAVGGPRAASGYSQVIYAGTDGFGPLLPVSPSGGHVWVTTNSDAGLPSWFDRTGSVNPRAYPISSIVIDPLDPMGETAYIAIMGFHTSHVWKTTNAGISWTDFNANLPDAPANALAIDPVYSTTSGTIYVGTDVGVFASSTGNPRWIEVGPGTGQAGFLPNVAVTSLKLFRSGAVKRLRAATYGRGVWEFNLSTALDFILSVSNPSLTAHGNSTATFNGTLTAVNGYNSSVTLSCGAGAPSTCAVTPSSIVPTASGAAFTIDVSSSTSQAYSFSINAVGNDAASISHSLALAFTAMPAQIFDFSMLVSPSNASVAAGHSTLFTLTLAPTLDTFPNDVSLACTGLPASTSCSFNPPQVNSGTANSVITVSVSTTASSANSALSILPFPLAGILWVAARRRRYQRFRLLLLACAILCVSCSGGLQGNGNGGGGGGGGNGTKPGTYTLTIAATCGTVSHSSPITLTVTP